MLSRIDLRGSAADPRDVLPRAAMDVAAALDAVAPVVADVRSRGGRAVLEATERFDGVRLASTRVPPSVLQEALDGVDPAVRAALAESARRVRLVCESSRREEVTTSVTAGGSVTQRWVPVRRVGLYVPGGLAPLASSVVMNVVPAQVAGVGSLAVASPPQPAFGGRPHPVVLAACALLGVEEVHAVGGAQAIAMLALGTQECSRVDLVTGPGNVYVTAAKRLLRGVVGVDSEAGPTEIGILADDSADPAYVAADLISQAEHDPNASCLLVTPSVELLDAVDVQLSKQVPVTRHRGRVESALAGQSAGVLVEDLEQGLGVVDAWAAEHLEVITRDARAWAERVHNAGAIFVGAYAPVSLGDYVAGSNHVLPTGGTARHSSGLSVQSFLRTIQVVDYDRAALAEAAPAIDVLAEAEDLPAHAEAVRARVPR